MTDAEKLAEALAFIADFSEWIFQAEPKPPFRHPADEPDPVTDAAVVWAWQESAMQILEKLE
jgi:hypothetical protein